MADGQLHVAKGLSLPLDAVTQTFGILARKGAGKTYTAAVFAEEILVAAYPHAVQPEQIDDATGYKRSSRNTYLQRLRSRRLVEKVGASEVRASEDLF